MDLDVQAWARLPQKIGGSGAGRYNDKDYFMRQTDQEGYVDMMPE